jgi:hypothetical protein
LPASGWEMMAKLRRLKTSAPGVLEVFVSMVILRLT